MRTRAFTIIELLIVVVIIGVLTSIATASLLKAQQNSRDDARKTTVNAIAHAVEAFRLAEQKYPGITNPANQSDCTLTSVYYYHPKDGCNGAAPATQKSLAGSDAADQATYGERPFAPSPNWIPGLGRYLNPPAIERNYRGTASTTSVPNINAAGAPITPSRTFTYKKTTSGYSIHTRLENPTGGTSGDDYEVSK